MTTEGAAVQSRPEMVNSPATQVRPWLYLAASVCIVSGLIGGMIWLTDWADRDDGDALHLGFWHNPFMQFPAFHEGFLDLSMPVLLACSAAVGLGGILLLMPLRAGVFLVTWQARVSIAINLTIAVCIVAMMAGVVTPKAERWQFGMMTLACALRMGSVAVDLMLWRFVGSKGVSNYIRSRTHPPYHGFEVVLKAPDGSAPDR